MKFVCEPSRRGGWPMMLETLRGGESVFREISIFELVLQLDHVFNLYPISNEDYPMNNEE
jgi:hypothetical protein